MEKKQAKKQAKAQKNYYPRRILRYFSYAGGVASGAIEGIVLGYLSFYLTDSIFLSAGVVAAILGVSRVFDGISDLIAGYIIDHTRTRWGKARPYSIFTVIMWIAVIFLFSVPDLSVTGKIVYVFLLYNLTETVAKTMVLTASPVHFKLGYTSDEQLELTGFGGFVGGILSLGVGVVLPILVDQYGASAEGWRMIALVIAIPSVILGLMKLFFVPEVDEEAYVKSKRKKASVKESVKYLFANKYIFMIIVPLVLTTLAGQLGVSTYYFKYIIGNISAASIIGGLGILAMFIMPFLPMLARKVGMRKTIVVSLLIGCVGILIPFLAPSNVLLVAIGMSIFTIAVIPTGMYSTVILVQCMKYTEWKDGKQIDGVLGATVSFTQKIGVAVGAIITGFMLGIAGYDGSLAVQSDAANAMIKFLYLGIPA